MTLEETNQDKFTHFATFGGGQLTFTKLNPMRIMAVLADSGEQELRAALREPPFNNKYCTTYPISELPRMIEEYDMYVLTLNEIRNS